jgi:hypothetical protein
VTAFLYDLRYAGRAFTDVESVEPRGVVVVNERLASRFWPGQDAVGKRLRWGLDVPQNPNPWLTIVGVMADVTDGALGSDPFIHAYEPFSQFPDVVLDNIPNAFGRHVKLAVRTTAEPGALVASVRGEIAGIDRLAIISKRTTSKRRDAGAASRRARFAMVSTTRRRRRAARSPPTRRRRSHSRS